MKKLLMLSILFLGITTWIFAQKKAIKKVEVKGVKVAKSRGENPNIVKNFTFNPLDISVEKPDICECGNDCLINADNYTGFYINVYADGSYKGMVSP